MKYQPGRTATVASSLALLLALGACGDRIEDTEKPMPGEASVEINRQGMDGAKASHEAAGVNSDGTVRTAVGGPLRPGAWWRQSHPAPPPAPRTAWPGRAHDARPAHVG